MAVLATSVVVGALAGTGGRTITLIAGTGMRGFSGDGGPATAATLDAPAGVAVDSKGNVYFGDVVVPRVRKVSPDGTITTFVVTGPTVGAGPLGVAVDVKGNVFIADEPNARMLKVSPGGSVTTLFHMTNRLYGPTGVAVDANGNVFFSEQNNNRVSEWSPGGKIRTIAGGGSSYAYSGSALSARLVTPMGLAVNARGDVYIAEQGRGLLREVTPAGRISTIAGDSLPDSPQWVALDRHGNVFITTNGYVVRLSLGGTITELSGACMCFSGPWTSQDMTPATLSLPLGGVAVDGMGNLYISGRTQVFKVPSGTK